MAINIRLSPHFWRHEFACKCGCGKDSIDVKTLALCEEVREHIDKSIVPSSGFRCRKYNAQVTKNPNSKSQHQWGRAVDLPVPDPWEVYLWLCQKYPDQFGFGVYNTFVHVDTRSGPPARWNTRKK